MNQRIKELITQAQKEVWGNNPYNGSPEFEGYELDAEKFAELIVKECVSIVKQRWIKPDEDVIAEEIKEHFGVEE
jgi:hypothetical protein